MTLEEKLEIEREEGIEKGHREGLTEGKIEVAKNLLHMNNLSIESISQATSLSIEEIQKIAKTLNK